MKLKFVLVLFALFLFGCGSANVDQAEKGQRFDKTGALALWSNKTGFVGDVIGPGTYYTGLYGSVRTVNCEQVTHKETLFALTKDGVQFSLDVYIRMSAKCDNADSVRQTLEVMSPAPKDAGDSGKGIGPTSGHQITNWQLYNTYTRPAIGEAVRSAVSPFVANDVNSKRDEIFKKIESEFMSSISSQKPQMVSVYEVRLNNLDFPDKLEQANVDRAEQAILKDKAIAEREKVSAETETAAAKMDLEKRKAENEAVRISTIGKSLRENPEFMQYQMLQQLPSIYRDAGSKGNLVITAPNPNVFINRK